MWFSRREICDRYKCSDDFLSLTAGRLRLAASLAWQYAKDAGKWALRQGKKDSAGVSAF
jgi:hypothetical protein